jgi:hypothetical protein
LLDDVFLFNLASPLGGAKVVDKKTATTPTKRQTHEMFILASRFMAGGIDPCVSEFST